MRKILSTILFVFAVSFVYSQTTKVNAVRLLKPGTNNTFLTTNGSSLVAWGDLGTIVSGGTGITVTNNTITNTSPDQTVALTGAGITAISGTYPNFTITSTEVDGDTLNEIQTLSLSGTTTRTVTLSDSGGSFNVTAGAGITIGGTGSDIQITNANDGLAIAFNDYEEVLGSSSTTVTVTGFTPSDTNTIVFVDGVRMKGGGDDYSLSGSVYTFTEALASGQRFFATQITLQ